MTYRVEFAPAAAREFRKLPRPIQIRLAPYVDALAANPRPAGAKKLRGDKNAWRIRVGDYRVVYEIRDRALVVLIIRVAHRREAYR